jgi:hypothetical protein
MAPGRKALLSRNLKLARFRWGKLNRLTLEQLHSLTNEFGFSLASGDLLLLSTSWYVTNTGLLGLAARHRCCGIQVQPIPEFSDTTSSRYVFKATVHRSDKDQGFVGYADADPSNVSPLVRGAELRVAETRAVNRALRKAYGIGICSIEEIGSLPTSAEGFGPQNSHGNAQGNGTAFKVRDRLCQLIRRHQLDPNLVKAYATDFCGVKTLREATRDQVENFVKRLSDWADKDRNALLCQLNSYARPDHEEPIA